MAKLPLTLLDEIKEISVVILYNKCKLFREHLTLFDYPYPIRTKMSRESFYDLINALEEKPFTFTAQNFLELENVSEEFGFDDLRKALLTFRTTQEFKHVQEGDDELTRTSISEFETEVERI
jgi:hypothetical protein